MSTTPDPESHGQHRPDPTADPSSEPATSQGQQAQVPPPPPAPEGSVPPPTPTSQGSVPPPPPGHGYAQPNPQPTYPQTGPPQTGYPQVGAGYPGQATAYGQQVLDPAQQRQWGMLSHLIGLVAMVFSAGLLGFVGSLIVYLMYRDRGDFVRRHSANSLNVQITMGVATVVGIILCLTVIGLIVGIPLLIAAWVWAFVVHIIGAMKANNGEYYNPPMAYSFVK